MQERSMLSMAVPDKILIPIRGANMHRILARRKWQVYCVDQYYDVFILLTHPAPLAGRPSKEGIQSFLTPLRGGKLNTTPLRGGGGGGFPVYHHIDEPDHYGTSMLVRRV